MNLDVVIHNMIAQDVGKFTDEVGCDTLWLKVEDGSQTISRGNVYYSIDKCSKGNYQKR